MSVSKRWK